MNKVLVDTGAWIAVVDNEDADHRSAARHLEALVRRRTPLLSTNYVLDETATRLRYDRGLRVALRFRDRIAAAESTGLLSLAWISRQHYDAAWLLIEQFADVNLSFTDATTAVIARTEKVSEIFTLDRDFAALGFQIAPG